jgi:hypothetical protein
MNRSLWVGIAATFLLFIVLAVYFYSKYIKPDDKPLYAIIPETAVAVVITSNFGESLEIVQRTELWQMLQSYPSSTDALNFLGLYDSLLQTTPLNEEEMAVSIHVQGDRLEWMVTMHLPDNANMNEVLSALNYRNSYRIKTRTYEGIKLYDLQDASGNYTGVVVATGSYVFYSTTGLLAESAIRKMRYKVRGQTDELAMLQPFEDKSAAFRLYVNYRQMEKLYACISRNPAEWSWFTPLQNLANWSMLNVSVQQNELVFKGISLTDDTVSQFLDLFRNQNPVPLDDINKFVPNNCAYLVRMGFSDFLSFKNELDDYHERLGVYARYKTNEDSISSLYKIDLNNLRAIIGKQVITGSLLLAGQQHPFTLIKTTSASAAAQLLVNYQQQFSKRLLIDSLQTTLVYKGYSITQWPFGNFMPNYFGSVYCGTPSPYVTLAEDVIVLAKYPETVMHILDAYQSNNVLSNDELYAKMKSLSGPTSNLDMYINTSQSFSIPLANVNTTMHSHLSRNEIIYKKFTAVHFQFASASDKYFHTQYTVQFQPEYEEKQRMLWQIKLDTTLISPPVFVFNKTEQVYDVIVQDVQNMLYCMAADGTLKWKTKMSGPVLSTPYSVTYHPSGKWGYLFNTAKSVSLIDTSGKNVSGYPIYLPGTASGSLLLTDFYNDSFYAFFIPLTNKRVMGYNMTGKAIPSWNPKVTGEKMANLKHGVLRNEPVLYGTTETKKLCIWKPDGTTIEHAATMGADFLITENQVWVVDSSTHSVTRFVFDEDFMPTQSSQVAHLDSGSFKFIGTMLVANSGKGMLVYDLNGKILTGPTAGGYAYQQSSAANDFMVFDSASMTMNSYMGSSLDNGFPVDASAPGTVGMLLNDGVRYLIVPVTGNYLNAFRLK